LDPARTSSECGLLAVETMENYKLLKIRAMEKIKMYVADTIDLVQKWVNENNLDYDSIKLQCHSCDNSTSGAVFTVYGREGNPANSENANCAIFDVSGSVLFDFAAYLTGHDIDTVKQMYDDWCNSPLTHKYQQY
jgi:hypothetical protein